MKFRIITNGTYYRAQVRTFFIWLDIDFNGYRQREPFLLTDRHSASSNIRKFLERKQESDSERGKWATVEEHY